MNGAGLGKAGRGVMSRIDEMRSQWIAAGRPLTRAEIGYGMARMGAWVSIVKRAEYQHDTNGKCAECASLPLTQNGTCFFTGKRLCPRRPVDGGQREFWRNVNQD